MVKGQKYQQWKPLKQGRMDYYDDEAGSSSSTEPILKKLKPVSDLLSIKKEDNRSNNSIPLVRRKRARDSTKINLSQKRRQYSIGNVKSEKHGNHLINKKGGIESPSLRGNLLYMQTILEELRTARENMFIWFRKEIQKILNEENSEEIMEEPTLR